jgi:hypothetical protein
MMIKWLNHRSLPALYTGIWLLSWSLLVMVGRGWSQNIVKVEYFFDTDPGYHAGTQLPVVPPTPHLSNFTFNASIAGLDDGFHKLYVRAEDENGVWSLSNNRPFLKNTVSTQMYDLTEVEYFFDNDPGPGNGTNVPFTPGPHITNLQFTIDISGLPAGFHHLYVRAKNEQGAWSLTNRRSFLKEVISTTSPLLSEAEYFIDTDPGLGQGTSVPVIPNGSNVTLDFNVDITGLPAGFHLLYVRARDTEGRWSLTTRRSFLKEDVVVTNKNVTALEYFFDSDPGNGQGQGIPCTPSPNVTVTDYVIDLTSLPDGFHVLHVRAMDEANIWSLTNARRFFKKEFVSPLPNLVAAEYFIDNDPGFGQATAIPVPGSNSQETLTFTTDVSGLNPGMHKIFVRVKDAYHAWSHTNMYIFYKLDQVPDLADIISAEYFIDTDPGLGQGIPIPVPNPAPNVDDLTFQVDVSGLIQGNHMLFARTLDDSGKWSLTLVYQFCHTPQANFSADNVWFGSPTTFVDLSLFTNQYTQYFWDVDGDGITDYTYNTGFTHTYGSPGTYLARLILVSQEGCSDTAVQEVSVYTCSPPSALMATNITQNSATLQWTPANLETLWDIEYGLTGFVQGTGTLLSNIPYNYYYLAGLIPETSYDFYVRSACPASVYSSWAGPATFTTLQGEPCANPVDGGTIAASQTICFGTVPDSLTSVAPATGYTGILQYKWQLSTDSLNYVDIPGAEAEGYSHNLPLTSTTWFRRLARVTCKPDWVGAAESNTVKITVVQRDQYRTKASGDWNNPLIWEYFDGTQWVNATTYPSTASTTCPNSIATIQNGHVVTVTASVEFGNVLVNTGATLDVPNDVTLGIVSGDSLLVYGTLIMHGTAIAGGAGDFVIYGGATMHVGSAEGITISAALGNVQVTGTRTYSSGASYIYMGTVGQVTGDGLTQNVPANLTINAPGMTVTLSYALVISGNINIVQGMLDVNNLNITLGGNWINNGIFIPGNATVYFNCTVNVYVSVSNFYNVVFAGTDTITAGGQLTIYGSVTINGYFNGGSYVHYVYGNWVNNGTFVYGTSTIQFVGGGTILISASYFYNVIFAGTGTVTATGSLTIYGNVTINNYFNAGTFVHYVYGNWVNTGTFIYGTSTINFVGSGNITIGPAYFYNVVFGGTGTITAIGELTFYGNVTINNYFNAGIYTLYVYGNWINNGTFVNGTSTVIFAGTANIYIYASNFYNVVFNGTGTITAAGPLTILGNVTINTNFNAGSYTISVAGNWTNNGTFNYGTSTIEFIGTGNVSISANSFYNVIFSGTGNFIATGTIWFYGDVTINSYFDAGSFVHYVYGNWINNGVFVYGTSTLYFVGSGNIYIGACNFYNIVFAGTGTITATGSLSFYGDVTITNHFDAGSYVHYVYGNWTNNGTFVYGTSTINFSVTANIYIGVNSFYNVVFAGSGTVIATGSLTFYGNVTINGYFDPGSFVHYVYGNWVNNGTFVYGTSTIHFLGSGNILVGSSNFYNIIFAGTGTITATGSLTIYGDVTITNQFNGGSFIHYIYGNWINNGTYVYGTSTVYFMGTVNVTVSAGDFYHVVFAGTGTITATGSLTIYGDITINGIFDAAEYDHYIYGNWINNGTFVYGTSTIHFVGSINLYIGVNNFYNVVFGGTGTITATGTLTIYGNVSITNHFNAGNYIHYVYGNWINTGTFIYGTSTIHFLGTVNKSIGASDFYHVVFAGTGIITATGSLHIYGDITITGQFDAAEHDHYLYGNWINNGVFVYGTSTIHFVGSINLYLGVNSFYNVVFGGTGTITATGNLTIYGYVSITNHFNAGSYYHKVYGNWTNTGTFVYGTSTIQFLGTADKSIGAGDFYHLILDGTGVITASGSLTVYGNIFIAGHFDAASFDHYVYGNWYNGGTFVHGTSTIHFVGSGNISINVNNFYNVVFAGTGTITATGSLTIYGNVTISHHFNGGSYVHYVQGNWTNNGTFVYGTCTIVFNGSVQQIIGGLYGTVFYNYTVNNPLGILLNVNLTVNNLLTLTLGIVTTGTYTFTVLPSATITGGSETAYINGKLVCGYNAIGSRFFPVGNSGYYGPLVFNYVTLTGTSLVQVEFVEGVIPGIIPSNIINVAERYWVISQSGGTNFTFTVTLNVPGFNPTGIVWMLKGDGLTVDAYATTTPDYTNAEVFNSMGDFTLGEEVCSDPYGLTNLDITYTTAELYWEPGNLEQEWNVEYGPAGFTPGTGILFTNVSSRPLLVTGLTPQTYYDFYVQAICTPLMQSNWVGPEPFSTFLKYLDVKVWLEGPYDAGSGAMHTDLSNDGLLPLVQPFQGSPWNYAGLEQVDVIPAGVVDWVLIEWRDAPSAPTATSATTLGRRAGFLLNDGSIVDTSGTGLVTIGNPQLAGNLFVVVNHRNHLSVMSAGGVPLAGEIYTWDFTPAAAQAYGGTLAQKQLAPGQWGMVSGDGDANGEVNNSDKLDVWRPQAGANGYKAGDFDLNGQVNNIDKIDKWKPNSGRSSQVPD